MGEDVKKDAEKLFSKGVEKLPLDALAWLLPLVAPEAKSLSTLGDVQAEVAVLEKKLKVLTLSHTHHSQPISLK